MPEARGNGLNWNLQIVCPSIRPSVGPSSHSCQETSSPCSNSKAVLPVFHSAVFVGDSPCLENNIKFFWLQIRGRCRFIWHKQINGKINKKKYLHNNRLIFGVCCWRLLPLPLCVSHKGNKESVHSWKVWKLTADDNIIFFPIYTAENKQMGKLNSNKQMKCFTVSAQSETDSPFWPCWHELHPSDLNRLLFSLWLCVKSLRVWFWRSRTSVVDPSVEISRTKLVSDLSALVHGRIGSRLWM